MKFEFTTNGNLYNIDFTQNDLHYIMGFKKIIYGSTFQTNKITSDYVINFTKPEILYCNLSFISGSNIISHEQNNY